MLNQPGADRVFHALADANRRAVIERLTRSPATVSELARLLGVTVAATVQHLQVLQQSGLVSSEKVGRVRTCQLDTAGLRRAEAWLQRQRTAWERRLDRLGSVLGEDAAPTDEIATDEIATDEDTTREPGV